MTHGGHSRHVICCFRVGIIIHRFAVTLSILAVAMFGQARIGKSEESRHALARKTVNLVHWYIETGVSYDGRGYNPAVESAMNDLAQDINRWTGRDVRIFPLAQFPGRIESESEIAFSIVVASGMDDPGLTDLRGLPSDLLDSRVSSDAFSIPLLSISSAGGTINCNSVVYAAQNNGIKLADATVIILPVDRDAFDFTLIADAKDFWRACAIGTLGIPISGFIGNLPLHDAVMRAESNLHDIYH